MENLLYFTKKEDIVDIKYKKSKASIGMIYKEHNHWYLEFFPNIALTKRTLREISKYMDKL